MRKFVFTAIILLTFFQSNAQDYNCKQAREKYLIANPDVKKAGMDPWVHYQNYGKKEGRRWEDCHNVDQLCDELTAPWTSYTCVGDCVNGNATRKYPDGTKYSGDFKNGRRHGSGIYYTKNGDFFDGQWVDDWPEGFGTFTTNVSIEGKSYELNYIGLFSGGCRWGYGLKCDISSICKEVYCRSAYSGHPLTENPYSDLNEEHKKSKKNYEKMVSDFRNGLLTKIESEKSSATINKKSDNSAKQEPCVIPFSTDVPKLSITYYDNRKMCKCCNERYCQSVAIDKNNAPYVEEIIYLMERKVVYEWDIKPTFEEWKFQTKCWNDFVDKKFGLYYSLACTRFEQRGNMTPFSQLSTNRKVGLYDYTSELCERCKSNHLCPE